MCVFPRSSPARRVLPHPGGAGRARRPAAYDELNDHLGAARVVFHRPTTTRVVRQLELSEAQDNTAFSYEDTYRTYTASAYSPTYVARLDGRAAPAPMVRSLSVAKGDTVTFSVYSLITAGFGTSSGTPSGQARQARLKTLILLGGAAAQPGPLFSEGPQSQPGNTGVSRLFSRVAAGIGYVLGSNSPSAVLQTGDPVPASGAWIRYRLTAEDGTIVDEHQEFVPLATLWRRTQVAVRAQQSGTLTLSVGTAERSGYTYFDDLTVEQTGGMIVQEQHQYAYGSPLVGLNYAVGNKRYRYGYQGQFAEKDAETGFESFELRLYNSRIGRWTSYDPEGQFSSPYVGMGNNPVSEVDPDGGLSLPWKVAISTVTFAGVGGTVAALSGQDFWKGAAIGALAGYFIGGGKLPDFNGVGKLHFNAQAGTGTLGKMTLNFFEYQGRSSDFGRAGIVSPDINTDARGALFQLGNISKGTSIYQTATSNTVDGLEAQSRKQAAGGGGPLHKANVPFIDNNYSTTSPFYGGTPRGAKDSSMLDTPYRTKSFGDTSWRGETSIVKRNLFGKQRIAGTLTWGYDYNSVTDKITLIQLEVHKASTIHKQLFQDFPGVRQ